MASYRLGDPSKNSSEAYSSVQYNDRLYSSASQALEDYIKDYNLSLVSPEIKPGRICVNHSTPRNFRPSKRCFQEKYVLENLKQRAVKVPVSPRSRRKNTCDSDLLSLTTDDLLAFPPDGSVSFNQVVALRPAHQNSNLKRKSQTYARHRTASFGNGGMSFPGDPVILSSYKDSSSYANHRTSSFGNGGISFPGDPVISSSYKDSSRKAPTKHTFHKYDSSTLGHSLQSHFVEQEKPGPIFHKNYPRWLTSQKSDLSVSGISSIPDSKYPTWLDSHNLLPNSENESFPQTGDGESDSSHSQRSKKLINGQNLGRINSSRHSEFNSLMDLQNKDTVLRNCKDDCGRVGFASDGSGEGRHSWRENGPKACLKKGKRTLESSTNEVVSFPNNDCSPCTVDLLEAERSWDNVPVGLKSPVPVYCEEDSPQPPKANIVDGFLEDCLKNSSETSDEDVDMKQCDNDIIPVTKSLQKALHHLSRLKGLVEDPSSKDESVKPQQDRKDKLA